MSKICQKLEKLTKIVFPYFFRHILIGEKELDFVRKAPKKAPAHKMSKRYKSTPTGVVQRTYHTFHPDDVLKDCPTCKGSNILDCSCRIDYDFLCKQCNGGVHIWQQHETGEIAIICQNSNRSPANCSTPPCMRCKEIKCICCDDCYRTLDTCICCKECGRSTEDRRCDRCTCVPCVPCPDFTQFDPVLFCSACNCHILECACFTGLYQCLTQTIFCRKCFADAKVVVLPSGETVLICNNSDLPQHECRYCRYCEQKQCACCYNCYNPPSECTCCTTCGVSMDECYCGQCRNCGYPEGDRRCTCEEDEEREKDEFLFQSSFDPSPCEDCRQMYCSGC